MSMHHPRLVSVIIPFYNIRVDFLQEAVESVLAQHYPHWEILLVDDGSIGRCTDVARDYAHQQPEKIRYLEHEEHSNRGLSASRNLGFREARGEYIAFLDADDVWLPEKLHEQVAILCAHPQVGMLYGNTEYWYSWSGDPLDARRDHIPPLGITSGSVVQPPTLLPLFLRGRVAVPCTCSILLRRETLEAIGASEEQFDGMYEDQVLYAKVCLQAPVFVSESCWDRYRQHADSMCAVAQDAGRERAVRVKYLEWLKEYLTERQVGDAELWRALREEHWLIRHPILGRQLKWFQRILRRRYRPTALSDSQF